MRSVASLLICSLMVPAAVSAQVSSSDLAARRSELMSRLPDALILIAASWDLKRDAEANFSQNPPFFYLTGLSNQIGAILLLDGPLAETTLFVTDEHRGVQFFHASVPTGDSTAQNLGLTRVLGMKGFRSFLEVRVTQRPGIRVIVANQTPLVTGVPELGEFADPGSALRNALGAQWPSLRLEAMGPELSQLRAIKSSDEIEAMSHAAVAASEALLAGMAVVGPGKTQREVEVEIAAACFQAGADGVSWWPWAQTGPNAVFPYTFTSFADYRHLDRVMQEGELARLDVGCQCDHYQSDVGRTVPVSGHWTGPQRETWNLLIAGYQTALRTIRDGIKVENVRAAFEEAIRQRQSELGTDLALAAASVLLDRTQSPFWQIHGVGLEAAEPIGPVLRAGMVVAFEPIFVVESQGFYLEDLLLVTQEGYELLSPDLPYTAREIEEAMQSR